MPADVVCVIDVSGSMSTFLPSVAGSTAHLDADLFFAADSSATYEGPDGTQINPQGLSLMDITKYACAAVANMLQPGDRMGLVTFNTQGKIKSPLEEMNKGGKGRITACINGLTCGALARII